MENNTEGEKIMTKIITKYAILLETGEFLSTIQHTDMFFESQSSEQEANLYNTRAEAFERFRNYSFPKTEEYVDMNHALKVYDAWKKDLEKAIVDEKDCVKLEYFSHEDFDHGKEFNEEIKIKDVVKVTLAFELK